MKPTFFPTSTSFRKWLETNHKSEAELFVGFYKVSTKKPSMTWSESVDQALCFGWIDGVRKSIDEESYIIRFTPRKSNSIWSAVNIKKIEELTKSGLMSEAGKKAFGLRTEKKSKIYAYEKEPVNLAPKYEVEFQKNKKAWNFFSKESPSYKKVMIHWIMNAKLEATRFSRLQKTIDISEEEKRMN